MDSDLLHRIELRQVGPMIDGRSVHGKGPFPTSQTFSREVVHALDPKLGDAIQCRLETLKNDDKAAKAAEFLRVSLQAADLAAEPLIGYAPLVAFHLCIETILGAVGGSAASEEEKQKEKNVVLGRLEEVLAKPGESTKRRAAAVTTANFELGEIDHGPFRRRLETTVARLDLQEKVEQRLTLFYNFRNEHFGHPNSLLAQETILTWVKEGASLARLTAGAFLDYLERKVDRNEAFPGVLTTITPSSPYVIDVKVVPFTVR